MCVEGRNQLIYRAESTHLHSLAASDPDGSGWTTSSPYRMQCMHVWTVASSANNVGDAHEAPIRISRRRPTTFKLRCPAACAHLRTSPSQGTTCPAFTATLRTLKVNMETGLQRLDSAWFITFCGRLDVGMVTAPSLSALSHYTAPTALMHATTAGGRRDTEPEGESRGLVSGLSMLHQHRGFLRPASADLSLLWLRTNHPKHRSC